MCKNIRAGMKGCLEFAIREKGGDVGGKKMDPMLIIVEMRATSVGYSLLFSTLVFKFSDLFEIFPSSDMLRK